MGKNLIVKKSYEFALEIIQLYKKLKEKKEYDIARQVLRSGTSIGANIQEAQGAQSKKDFIYKFHISLKEAKETHYWLNLISDSQILTDEECLLIKNKNITIIKLITKILITTKSNMLNIASNP
jgi:four helix bundle protein